MLASHILSFASCNIIHKEAEMTSVYIVWASLISSPTVNANALHYLRILKSNAQRSWNGKRRQADKGIEKGLRNCGEEVIVWGKWNKSCSSFMPSSRLPLIYLFPKRHFLLRIDGPAPSWRVCLLSIEGADDFRFVRAKRVMKDVRED